MPSKNNIPNLDELKIYYLAVRSRRAQHCWITLSWNISHHVKK